MEGQRYENFGALLYTLRVTYAQRRSRNEPGALVRNIRMTQQDVINYLRDQGYHISPGMYSEIESGRNYPRNAETFLRHVSECLELDEREQDELRRQLTYDIIKQRLGESFADKAFTSFSPRDEVE